MKVNQNKLQKSTSQETEKSQGLLIFTTRPPESLFLSCPRLQCHLAWGRNFLTLYDMCNGSSKPKKIFYFYLIYYLKACENLCSRHIIRTETIHFMKFVSATIKQIDF